MRRCKISIDGVVRGSGGEKEHKKYFKAKYSFDINFCFILTFSHSTFFPSSLFSSSWPGQFSFITTIALRSSITNNFKSLDKGTEWYTRIGKKLLFRCFMVFFLFHHNAPIYSMASGVFCFPLISFLLVSISLTDEGSL